jgi:hypothetical protein
MAIIAPDFHSRFEDILKRLQSVYILLQDEGKKKYGDRVLKTIKHLYLYELLTSRSSFAVTGLQGVGKTSMISEIYGLQDVLIENLGSGETRPLFITESIEAERLTFKQHFVFPSGNGLERQQRIIEPDKARRIMRNNEMNTGEKTVAIELLIPKEKWFIRDDNYPMDFSFVLFPGFNDERLKLSADWEYEIKYPLLLSNGYAFCTDQDAISQEKNEKSFQRIQALSQDVEPLCVLTKGDTLRENTIDEIREQLAAKISIDASKSTDLILIKGNYDKEPVKNESWKNSLRQSILNRNRITEAWLNRECEAVSCLTEELQGILEGIITLQEDLGLSRIVHDSQLYNIMREFEGMRSKVSKRFMDDYRRKLSQDISSSSFEKMKELIKDPDLWERILQFIRGGVSLKEQDRFKQSVTEAWKEDYANSRVNEVIWGQISDALYGNVFRQTSPKPAQPLEAAGDKQSISDLPMAASQNNPAIADSKILCAIHDLMKPDTDLKVVKDIPHWTEAVRFIPLLSLYWFLSKRENRPLANPSVVSQETHSISDNESDNGDNKWFKAVAAFIGLDSLDGKVDSLSAVAQSISNTTIFCASNPWLAAAAGVVLACKTLLDFSKFILHSQYQEAEFAQTLIRAICNYNIEQTEDSLNQFFDTIQEHLEKRLRELNASDLASEQNRMYQLECECNHLHRSVRQLVMETSMKNFVVESKS